MSGPVEIPVFASGRIIAFALVDPVDAYDVLEFRWSLHYKGYARTGSAGGLLLHRFIARPGAGLEVDHINRDPLDCRRANLRAVTRAQNNQNKGARPGTTSPYRGVSWSKKSKKWVAQVRLNDVVNYLGCYDDEEEAARVARAFREEHMTHTVEAAAA